MGRALRGVFPLRSAVRRVDPEGRKRNRRVLGATTTLLVVAHYVDVYWVVKPAFAGAGLGLHWLDIVLPVAMGGLWLATFAWQLSRWPLLARNDPQLAAKLEMAHE